MTSLRLTLLGEFEARDGAGRLIAIDARKNRALLAALALSPSHSLPRERIARLLWSDRADPQARSSLRQALAALRKDLSAAGPSLILTSDNRARLDPQLTEVDAVAFRRLAASVDIASLQAAATLYRGELLADIEIRDAAFEDWLRSERRQLADLATHVFEKLCDQERGEARIEVARRLVALDPLRESAHRRLMKAYIDEGERDLALRQYKICRDMLQADFNLLPGEQTTALHQRALDSPVRGEAPVETRAAPARESQPEDKPSIAVLPFAAMTDEPDLEAFADGLTGEVIAGLARIRAILVVARHTMWTYKGRAVDSRGLGRDLSVRYILDGSVRRHGTLMRVSAQLVEAATGHHVWAGRIDRPVADGPSLQDEVTGSIVASVQTQLILHEGRVAPSEEKPSAARLLARSWQQLLSLTEPSLAGSRTLAERAASLGEGSGLAHRMLAVSRYHQIYMGFLPWTEAAVEDVRLHATRAIETEDADEYSHWAMACAHLLRKEHTRAITSLRRALEINPHCSLAHGSMGTVLAWSGQVEAAIARNALALRMNPDDPTNFFRHFGLALAEYLASRYDEALAHSTMVLQIRPVWWLGLILSAASLARSHRLDDARRTVDLLERVRTGVTCGSLQVLPFGAATDREHVLEGLRRAGMTDGT